jgi:carbon storage regulator
MLVLTRRAGESIMIDDDIELKVLKIRGSQVHLGIDAPKRAAVHRKEVWIRIQNEAAAEAEAEAEAKAGDGANVTHINK